MEPSLDKTAVCRLTEAMDGDTQHQIETLRELLSVVDRNRQHHAQLLELVHDCRKLLGLQQQVRIPDQLYRKLNTTKIKTRAKCLDRIRLQPSWERFPWKHSAYALGEAGELPSNPVLKIWEQIAQLGTWETVKMEIQRLSGRDIPASRQNLTAILNGLRTNSPERLDRSNIIVARCATHEHRNSHDARSFDFNGDKGIQSASGGYKLRSQIHGKRRAPSLDRCSQQETRQLSDKRRKIGSREETSRADHDPPGNMSTPECLDTDVVRMPQDIF